MITEKEALEATLWRGNDCVTQMRPTTVLRARVTIDPEKASLVYDINRKIRTWLGQNCAVGWETEATYHNAETVTIDVFFEVDREDDLMLFKLTWGGK